MLPCPSLQGFNSKLVRLKVDKDIFEETYYEVFQFQTGSIKRVVYLMPMLRIASFQFQTGSIKSAPPRAFMPGCSVFQFQTGSIKSSRHSSKNSRLHVSIPNWFD